MLRRSSNKDYESSHDHVKCSASRPVMLYYFCHAGDAWNHLKSFVSVMKAIATALSEMVKGNAAAEADPVVWTFTKLAEEYKEKHNNFNL